MKKPTILSHLRAPLLMIAGTLSLASAVAIGCAYDTLLGLPLILVGAWCLAESLGD